MSVGKRETRVDAWCKATGTAQYAVDLAPPNTLVAKIFHAPIAHGRVRLIHTEEAQRIPGVVRVVTCFDVPQQKYSTAGHPWSTDPAHQDVADRLLLTQVVRYYGDDIAAVIAENEISAVQAVRALRAEFEEFPVVLDITEAMRPGAPQIHEDFPGNILAHSSIRTGNYDQAVGEDGLIRVEGWYDTPTVQHCSLENHACLAYKDGEKLTVVTSTQIPHIVRRIVGQALNLPWGSIRIIKPYVGGGFGSKQDALYEPLCAYLSMQAGGRPVLIDLSREESFINTRVRHAVRTHIISYVRTDGTFAGRQIQCFSDQGAYVSHGHGIAGKGMATFPQLYPCDNICGDAYTVFTNKPVAGAMRGYGVPQAMFAGESHIDDIARVLGWDPLAFRLKNSMPKGYVDPHSGCRNTDDSLRACLEKGKRYIDYERKLREYAEQSGPVRRGIGVAAFWYNTASWPDCLESSSCRMSLNQDGSVQLQLGETEIGQGADTAFSQMAAEALGVPFSMIHIVSAQDTDVTPFGTGAYASRQTYVAGFAIQQTADLLKEKVFRSVSRLTKLPPEDLTLRDGKVTRKSDGRFVMTLGDAAVRTMYNMENSSHITAESTYHIRSNAFSLGCCFAEVEVDIPMCRVRLLQMINVHDCGRLINPALAEAQVHGGMSMAIGYALGEQLLFDKSTGRPLNNNLLDYKLSTTMDHPRLTALFVENPEPTSPFGTKGLGEPPTCPGAPAIRNAICNATGVAINRIPITPQVLYEHLKEKYTPAYFNEER